MIIFIYGADTFRSLRFLQELRHKFTQDLDHNASSLSSIDGTTTTLAEISEQINTGSLFVKKRLVVIENIFQNKKKTILDKLSLYLKKIDNDENNIIIFRDKELNTKNRTLKTTEKKLFNLLAKQKYSQEFKTLSNNQLLKFINKELKQYNKKMSISASSLLLSLSGTDSWLIANNLRKLAFSSQKETITSEDVKNIIASSYDKDIFAFSDALSIRNKKLAAKLLNEQYEAGLSNEYLLTMIIRQFKILLRIRTALDKNINSTTLAKELKLHPFVIKKGLNQVRNFSIESLKTYLQNLISLDFLNKTGKTDIKSELILLISKL